jgi:hypothetical protein
MWGNDVHGDCVTAEEAFAKACNDPEIYVTDDTVIAWATRHGVLEGAYLTQVMGWMQNDGFADDPYVYDDGPYFSVDWTNAGTRRAQSRPAPSSSASRRIRSRTPRRLLNKAVVGAGWCWLGAPGISMGGRCRESQPWLDNELARRAWSIVQLR